MIRVGNLLLVCMGLMFHMQSAVWASDVKDNTRMKAMLVGIEPEVLKQSSKELQEYVRDAMKVCRGNEIGSVPCNDALYKASEQADKELEVLREGEGRKERVRYGGLKAISSPVVQEVKGRPREDTSGAQIPRPATRRLKNQIVLKEVSPGRDVLQRRGLSPKAAGPRE